MIVYYYFRKTLIPSDIGIRYSPLPLARLVLKYCENRGMMINGNYVDRLIKHFGAERVFGVNVRSARSNGDPNPIFNVNKSQVTIDKLMQNVIEMGNIKSGRIGFPNQMTQDLRLFINHWKNVVIRDEEDERTGLPYKSITRKGDDHYAQADTYSMVGVNYLTKIIQDNASDQLLVSSVGSEGNSNMSPMERALLKVKNKNI